MIKHIDEDNKFTLYGVEGVFKGMMEETSLKLGKIATTVRVALTGGTVSPSIYDVVSVLGKEAVFARLKKALASIG